MAAAYAYWQIYQYRSVRLFLNITAAPRGPLVVSTVKRYRFLISDGTAFEYVGEGIFARSLAAEATPPVATVSRGAGVERDQCSAASNGKKSEG